MIRTFIITSAAYTDPDFISTFGRLPPAFLPIANKRLYEFQASLISDLNYRKLLSVPKDFDIAENELIRINDLGFELIRVPLELSLGESIANVLKQGGIKEGELRILHGDTLVEEFPFEKLDVVSEGKTADYFSWAEYNMTPDGRTFFFDGLVDGPAANSKFGEKNVLSGYFCFADASLYQDCLQEAKYDFISSLNEYACKRPLTLTKEGYWLDFGHLDKYYQSKAQMTTERTFNELQISRRTVRKYSEDKHKIQAEAAWFKNIPKPLKVFAPQFLGEYSDGKNIGYETEYLYLSPLSDLNVFGQLPTFVWQRIFQSCDDFLTAGKNFPPVGPQPQFDWLFRDKTIERLEQFASHSGIKLNHEWRYGSKQLPGLETIALQTADTIPPTSPTNLQIIHGDFCFSNIFYDFRANTIRVVDPRGLIGRSTPTIYGDVRYDIAKLFHSAVDGYDFIISDRYYLEDTSTYQMILKLPEEKDIAERQEVFCERTFAGQSMEMAAAKPISILLFLSMLPLHEENTLRQRALLANALRLYADMDI